jgi:hypothetical protein
MFIRKDAYLLFSRLAGLIEDFTAMATPSAMALPADGLF